MTRSRATALLAGAALMCAALGVAAPAQAAPKPLPPQVFAPYFEVWNEQDPAALAQQAGASHLTLSFLQTAKKGSCDLVWDGDASRPVSQAEYGASIQTIRDRGGDVIPALGGYGAGSTGTELADSCTDVDKIAAALQKVVTTYDVTRIDIDVEDGSLTNTAGIDRRNKAIKKVEDWAATNGRTVQFVYTLPTTTQGLGDTGMDVMRNAVSNGARIDIVNLMTFDYYDNQPHNMADDTKTATAGLVAQLKGLYPSKSQAELWAMVGITEMIGIDDFGPAETFTTADAAPVLAWAKSKGVSYLSFWALQRDNGGCVGTAGANECSGISQSTWFFTHAFEPFTSGSTTPTPTPTPTVTPTPTPSVTPTVTPTLPGGCTAAAWSSSKVYTGGQLVSNGNHTWKAKWWTQGEAPGSSDVWADQGGCTGVDPTPTPTVTPKPTGTVTPTPTPTATVSPTTGSCASAAWSASKAYSGGAQVSYGNRTWSARWWTQGDVPGANAQDVWTDKGAC